MNFFEWMFVVCAFIFFLSMMTALILMANERIKRVKLISWILGLLIVPLITILINFIIIGKDIRFLIYLILIISYLLAELFLDRIFKIEFRSKASMHIPYIILEYAACFSFVFGVLTLNLILGGVVSFLFWAFLGVLIYYLVKKKKKEGENLREIKDEELPKNPMEAQGILIKAIYEKFGTKALSIIREVCKKQGRALGLKIRKKLPDNKLSTVAKAFSKSYNPNEVNIIRISDEVFQIQGYKCPFGIENTSRELCEAVMEIDAEYFRTAVDDNIELKIIKTVAEGAKYCDTIYKFR